MAMNRRHQKRRRETIGGFVPTQNPEQAQWMALLARSNATQRHIPTPRKGTRTQRAREAIRDQQRNQEG